MAIRVSRIGLIRLALPLGMGVVTAAYLRLALHAPFSASFTWLLTVAVLIGVLLLTVERMVGAVLGATISPPRAGGTRRRRELDREKMFALRALKELEFDYKMGKLSESDHQQMAGPLRERARRIFREIDDAPAARAQTSPRTAPRACASCSTVNDPDADFCKRCGSRF